MPIIKKVIAKEEGNRPIVVSFQNYKIKSDEKCDLKSSLYKNVDGKTVVGVVNDKILYTGLIKDESEYNNFILVRKKDCGKARLIQVDCCAVSPALENKSSLMDVSIATPVNLVSDLNKQFGSKRIKRYTEQQERLKMKIDTIKGELEKTVAEIKSDETDINYTAPGENDSLYRPKIYRDASTIDQVYNLKDIVPESVLNSLSDEALSIAEGADITAYGLSSFVATNISEILSSVPKDSQIDRINVFLYINYLLKFMNTPVKNITKKFVVCDKSKDVNNHILENYSITNGHHRTRPLSMKDKALCSILVLAAFARDYQVNIELLSKDLKLGIKKVTEISRILAFTVSAKDKTVVTLKLPLPEPISVSSKRKRK